MTKRTLIPKRLFSVYHYLWAVASAFFYGFPSKKMVVIGVTGTKGKTSTANFIWSCLKAGGLKTGIITTANIRIGETETLNPYHMTMPGRFFLQKLLARMVKENCKYCVVETTSEGIKQHRNVGIFYDIAVFTNLTPEHLPSHGGSFEKYKQAKAEMFKQLSRGVKIVDGKRIEKVIIANSDSEYAPYFLSFPADKKITFGFLSGDCVAQDVLEKSNGVEFKVGGIDQTFKINIAGRFNVLNALPAVITGKLFGLSESEIVHGLNNLKIIPGRMEFIDEGQNFFVVVDYAHEKESMTKLLETAQKLKSQDSRVIVLLGAEGGGRDKTKRAQMGEAAAKMADYVVVSNVDPYNDNPAEIIQDIAYAAEKFGKKKNGNLFMIEDRREGIKKALSLAKSDDIVLITGKGAEQSISIGGKKFSWDDRVVVREQLKTKNEKVKSEVKN